MENSIETLPAVTCHKFVVVPLIQSSVFSHNSTRLYIALLLGYIVEVKISTLAGLSNHVRSDGGVPTQRS